MSAFEVHRDEFGRLPEANKSCFMKKPLDQKEIKKMLNQIQYLIFNPGTMLFIGKNRSIRFYKFCMN